MKELEFVCIKIIYRGKGYGEVEKKDERQAVAEFGMLSFVMPDFHAQESPDTSAKEGNGDETGFRDPPFVVPCFPFIDTIQKKRHDINRREVDEESI